MSSPIRLGLAPFREQSALQMQPLYKVPFAWIKNRRLDYGVITTDEAEERRRSDTLFVLGAGPCSRASGGYGPLA